MASLTNAFLTNGPLQGGGGDIPVSSAYKVIWREIQHAIADAASKNDEKSSKVVDELKALREHLKHEAERNAGRTINQIPPDILREFLDVTKAIKQILGVSPSGISPGISPGISSGTAPLGNIRQNFTGLGEQVFTGWGPIGTAAVGAADAIAPGMGFVVKAIQENSAVIRSTYHAITGVARGVQNTYQTTASTVKHIHDFLNPNHPLSIHKALAGLAIGTGALGLGALALFGPDKLKEGLEEGLKDLNEKLGDMAKKGREELEQKLKDLITPEIPKGPDGKPVPLVPWSEFGKQQSWLPQINPAVTEAAKKLVGPDAPGGQVQDLNKRLDQVHPRVTPSTPVTPPALPTPPAPTPSEINERKGRQRDRRKGAPTKSNQKSSLVWPGQYGGLGGTGSMAQAYAEDSNQVRWAEQDIVPFAKGGIVDRPTIGLLGEAGPEMVVPLKGEFNTGISNSGDKGDVVVQLMKKQTDLLGGILEALKDRRSTRGLGGGFQLASLTTGAELGGLGAGFPGSGFGAGLSGGNPLKSPPYSLPGGRLPGGGFGPGGLGGGFGGFGGRGAGGLGSGGRGRRGGRDSTSTPGTTDTSTTVNPLDISPGNSITPGGSRDWSTGDPGGPPGTTPEYTPGGAVQVGGGVTKRLSDWVASIEQFNPKSFADFGQRNIGYGTSARPGETSITEPEARRRMNDELAKHMEAVNRLNPNLDQGTKEALTSLSYNAGEGWMKSGLGAAARAGDINKIKEIFVQYNKAGGKPLAGLIRRREHEVQFIGNPDYKKVTDAPVPTKTPVQTQTPVSATQPSSGGTLIAFRGLRGEIDTKAVEQVAASRGQTVKYFDYTEADKAAEFVKTTSGPYSVLGFSAGANKSTLKKFFNLTPRQPERLDTVGRSEKSPEFRPPGMPGKDDPEHSPAAIARLSQTQQPTRAIQPPARADARIGKGVSANESLDFWKQRNPHGAQLKGVLQAELHVTAEAARMFERDHPDLGVRILGPNSGVRTGGQIANHGPGYALDIMIYDKATGKEYANMPGGKTRAANLPGPNTVGLGESAPFYQELANNAKIANEYFYPGSPIRYGGNFGGGYGRGDVQHIDKRPGAPEGSMGGWPTGYSKEQMAYLGMDPSRNRGLGSPKDIARRVAEEYPQGGVRVAADATAPAVAATQPLEPGATRPPIIPGSLEDIETRRQQAEPVTADTQSVTRSITGNRTPVTGADIQESLRQVRSTTPPTPAFDKHHPSPEMQRELESLHRPFLDDSFTIEGKRSPEVLDLMTKKADPSNVNQLLRGDHMRSDEGGAFLRDRLRAGYKHIIKGALEKGVDKQLVPTTDEERERGMKETRRKGPIKASSVEGSDIETGVPMPRPRPGADLGVRGGGPHASDLRHGIDVLRDRHHGMQRPHRKPSTQHGGNRPRNIHHDTPDVGHTNTDVAAHIDATTSYLS